MERLLAEDGILIFDVQTPYKLREYLGDHIFTWHSPDVEYMWENHFDQETQICQMEVTFFQRCENGLYRRETMYQEERLYELELLKLWLNFSNLELLGCLLYTAPPGTDCRLPEKPVGRQPPERKILENAAFGVSSLPADIGQCSAPVVQIVPWVRVWIDRAVVSAAGLPEYRCHSYKFLL